MTRAPYHVVRLTHLPTGTTAQADGQGHGRNIRERTRWAAAMARHRLLAKLCRPDVAPFRRSYHLDPPPGIEPYIRQDGVTIAEGRENVLAVLGGKIPEKGSEQ